MAIKTIDLVINTSRAEKNIKEVLAVAKRFERELGKINKLKINVKTDPAKAAFEKLNAEIQRGSELTRKVFSVGVARAFSNSIGEVRDELSAVRKAFDSTSNATQRMERATALIAGNFKKIRMESTATAMASGQPTQMTVGSVRERLKEIRQFPRTMLAGREAMSLLNRMQELTVAGSKEFLMINKAIGKQLKINSGIQAEADKARGITNRGKTQKDKASEEKLKAEKKVTNELAKQKRLEDERFKRVLKNIRNRRRIREGIGGVGGRQQRQRRQGTMLGAGFPLLFGGGAGAIGGSLLGSFLAPPGQEFGAQILGSALGTLLERNLQTVRAIGNAASNLDLASLEQSSIKVNAELDRTIKNLQRIGESEKARELLSKEIASQTGTIQGTSENLADNINLLVDEFKEFTSLAATALGIISVPFVAALTLILDTVNMILRGFNLITSAIGFAISELIRLIRFLPGGQKILDAIDEKVKSVNEGATKLTISAQDTMDSLKEQLLNLQERISLGDKEAAIQKKIRDILAENPSLKKKEVEEAVRAIAAAEKQLEQQRKLENLYRSIGTSIENGIVDAIQGAIDGTKTLGDVARSVFSQIQRSLIRFGVNSLLTGLFPGSSLFRANGGPVSGNKRYIVGERGPEMFVPNSGGRIIPNSDMSGSTNVVVNVDASGSNVQGDQQRGKELGAALSVAIQSELLKQKRPGGLLA
tara:strand:- start:262 stop:2379 length:2118 start_codon:yes stop_codon:yes gene_type:complete